MKKLRFPTTILLLFISLLFFWMRVEGQPGSIIVTKEDAKSDLTVIGSNELKTLIGQVTPRFVVYYANSISFTSLSIIPQELQTLLGSLGPKITIQYANHNSFISNIYPSILVGDNKPPVISQISIYPGKDVTVSWKTDEYADSEIYWGSKSGSYTENLIDRLYYRQHVLKIVGLLPKSTYYYQIRCIDRSGNISYSSEGIFKTTVSIYYPIIKK